MKFHEISHKFRECLGFSEFFLHVVSKCHDSLSFPEHFCEIPAKSHQIFAEKSQHQSKNTNEMKFFHSAKNFDVFLAEILRSFAVQKYENLVDLEKCCKMTVWLLS